MRQFNVLVKAWYKSGFITCFVLPVNATDEDEAERSADNIVQSDSFTDVDEYEIQGISLKPFYLKKWSVKVAVSFRSHPGKQSFQYIRVGATTAEAAEDLALEIVAARKGVVNVEPLETLPYDPNP